MPQRGVVTLFLFSFCLCLVANGASAANGVQCVRTQCEGQGQACVASLRTTYDACMAAGNQKCNSVQPAEKFTCLRNELKPCATERNAQQEACLNNVQSCYAACAPMEGERADYWCVGDGGTATFCQADPANPGNVDVCERELISQGEQGGMTCEPL